MIPGYIFFLIYIFFILQMLINLILINTLLSMVYLVATLFPYKLSPCAQNSIRCICFFITSLCTLTIIYLHYHSAYVYVARLEMWAICSMISLPLGIWIWAILAYRKTAQIFSAGLVTMLILAGFSIFMPNVYTHTPCVTNILGLLFIC